MTTTMYVAYHKSNQKTVGSTALPIDGDFIASEPPIDITTGGSSKETPQGADYADVWADGPFWVKKGSATTSPSVDSTAKPVPANTIIQIQNLQDFGSQIQGYAL
jgi:hypothetical protein